MPRTIPVARTDPVDPHRASRRRRDAASRHAAGALGALSPGHADSQTFAALSKGATRLWCLASTVRRSNGPGESTPSTPTPTARPWPPTHPPPTATRQRSTDCVGRPRAEGARRRHPLRCMPSTEVRRAARRVQLRGGARRPGARRTLCTLSALGEGANEADGPLSAADRRVENRGQSREQEPEQPHGQGARELVAGGFAAWDVGGDGCRRSGRRSGRRRWPRG